VKHTCLEHEKVVLGPEKMIIIPPRHYVIIDNPAIRENGEVMFDENGQVLLAHGDSEVRFDQDPFSLYPGEILNTGVKKLEIVSEGVALRLEASRDVDYEEEKNGDKVIVKRSAGEEFLFHGPGTFYPKVGIQVLGTVKGEVLHPNQALKIKAREDCEDVFGNIRKAGEEYIVQLRGLYIPSVKEQIVQKLDGIILTQTRAIHVKALQKFEDNISGTLKKAGSEWLITNEDCEVYIPDASVEITNAMVPLRILTSRQYCVILDPVDEKTGKPLLGSRKYIQGPCNFFLRPGESISHTDSVIILGNDSMLEMSANESFYDEQARKERRPGDKWMIYGPSEYWPPVETTIIGRHNAFLFIEPLNLYFFSPPKFFAALVLGITLFFYIIV